MQPFTEDASMANIKLIACDMDKTLLADDGTQPENMVELVERMTQAGIVFCPASGRPAPKLMEMFADHADALAFCPDNGGSIIYRGKRIYESVLDRDLCHKTLSELASIEGVVPILGAFDKTYLLKRDRPHESTVSYFYGPINFVDDICTLDVDSNKIALYLPGGSSKKFFDEVVEPRYGKQFYAASTNDQWIDMMNLGVDKGRGVQHLCEKLGIDPADAAAFGDTYNDAPMLEAVGHSYLVANAGEHMRTHARFCAPSNNDRGVATVIEAILAAHGA